ncbi:MAG TPA: hypothetical protein VGG61_02535 [Gemmataceae bacterium]|jgi:hypothetical protein
MTASVHTFDLPATIAAQVKETREVCATIQDTLDSWIKAGDGFNTIACYWIEQNQGEKGRTVKRLRKSKDGKAPSGLRKRCIAFLEGQFESTGFSGKEINRALRLFALEKSAPWVQGLKSESKARELSALAAWHWDGCKLTREGDRSIQAVKAALTDAGLETVTRVEVREIVSGIIGRKKAKKNRARTAAVAFFKAIEGTDDTPPADKADVLAWLAVLLTESPLAAEVIVQAVETHLDGLTAATGRTAAAAA